jgi:hypothetical protein
MGNFTIGEAWSQAMAFLTENLQMLVVVVGGGVLIAAILQYLVVGGDQMAQLAALQAAFTSGDFSQLAQANAAAGAGVGALAGLIGIAVSIIQSGAEFAGARLGLSRGQDDVGSAIGYGLVAALLTLLLFAAAIIGVSLIIALPIVVLGMSAGFAGSGGPGGGMIAAFALLALALFVVMIWILVRLSVMQPAMAAVRSTNPIYGVTESWRLTRGNALMIFIYLFLLGIAAIVIFFVAAAIVGVVGGLLGAFAGLVLTTIVVSIPLSVLSLAVGVGIYRALSPEASAGDTFA